MGIGGVWMLVLLAAQVTHYSQNIFSIYICVHTSGHSLTLFLSLTLSLTPPPHSAPVCALHSDTTISHHCCRSSAAATIHFCSTTGRGHPNTTWPRDSTDAAAATATATAAFPTR